MQLRAFAIRDQVDCDFATGTSGRVVPGETNARGRSQFSVSPCISVAVAILTCDTRIDLRIVREPAVPVRRREPCVVYALRTCRDGFPHLDTVLGHSRIVRRLRHTMQTCTTWK